MPNPGTISRSCSGASSKSTAIRMRGRTCSSFSTRTSGPTPVARRAAPDLEMWRILVLAVLKQGLGCDFDHVRELANQHMTLREMLGHGPSYLDDERYDRRFLKDNVTLLSPELLREVNSLMASAGRAAAKGKPGKTN